MTERWIMVDADVFAALQRRAEPLVDDANSVLRRVLRLSADESEALQRHSVRPSEGRRPMAKRSAAASPRSLTASSKARQVSSVKPRGDTTRAQRGSLLPEAEYVRPLLEALFELDGSAPTSEVVRRVGRKLDTKLTDADRQLIKSGDVRWKNRLQFVRLGLIKQGLMMKNSPRGIWEISESGKQYLNEYKEMNK